MKKAVILLANGFEEIEALSPADYLRRAGAEVTIAATGTSSRNVEGAHKILTIADMTLDTYFSTEKELPDAVVIPGGMPGAKNISECAKAMEFINQMFKAKKIVAAICASPAVVLGKTEILNGKNWTCYPEMEKSFEEFAGENWQEKVSGSVHHTQNVVIDGNLITSRGAGTALDFSFAIIEKLFDKQTMEKVKNSIVA